MGRNRTRKRRQQHQPTPPIETDSGLFEARPFAAPATESARSAPVGFAANGHSLSQISPTVQAKLTVGAAHDPYEQQADQTAATVVSRLNQPSFDPTPRRKRKRKGETAPLSIQPLGTAAPSQAGPAPGKVERSIEAKRGQGRPLEDGTRSQMEGAFGHDFSGVNVHTDGESDQLNQSLSSRAFTTGQDIFFRQGEYAPSQRGGQELLAHELTHVVQQRGQAVQRHPSHAEEEEVQAKIDLQRHPSHAEEEEIQAKYTKSSLPSISPVQRQALQTARAHTLVQRGPIDWIKKRMKGGRLRERELSQKYGVTIGGGKKALSHGILDKLDKVLAKIPKEHLTGSYLQNIGGGDGIGDASAYTIDTKKGDTTETGHIGIVVPSMVPGWLYPLLSKAYKYQRSKMDEGAISSLAPDVTKQKDEALGLNNAQREVFAGVSDVLSRGNLLEWTILHEMGHAVDHKIKFTQTQSRKPEFGGWKQHEGEAQKSFVANQFLKQEGIDYADQSFKINAFQTETLLNLFKSCMAGNNVSIPLRANNEIVKDKDPGFPGKISKAEKLVKIARSQPWMFSDGGQKTIGLPDGRIYHLDHYGTWVSYEIKARDNALSNYQFSSPGEWFAEAYAAFYDLNPESPARDRLNNETKVWFTQNLGLPPQPKPDPKAESKKAEPKKAEPRLVDDQGILKDLTEIIDDVADPEYSQQEVKPKDKM